LNKPKSRFLIFIICGFIAGENIIDMIKTSKTNFFILLAITSLGALGLVHCTADKAGEVAEAPLTEDAIVKRGEYLVTILGCHDCHSPKRIGAQGPELIPELLLSGYPADRPLARVVPEALQNGWALFNEDLTAGVGPWGASFAANITSDDTGIGTWSLEQFKRALTEGKYKGLEGGRMLLPPMPWFNFVQMADEDIEAIFKYLQSTPPVPNVVPTPIALDELI
jgi:mono/diheme cytochrome c family protein